MPSAQLTPAHKRATTSKRQKPPTALENNWATIRQNTVLLSSVDKHKLIQKGISTRMLRDAIGTFHVVAESQLLHAIGLSSKTLGRRQDKNLGPRHSDAAMALIEITDMAQRVLGQRELAETWLNHPAIALDGQKPLDMLSSAPGIESVKDLLTRLEYGVYA
jgi:putative toxin-antitoxin system antitoxin component (TIGR02293 family)